MRLFALAVTACLGCTASAQQYSEANPPREYQMIRSSNSYRQAVVATYQDFESALSTHCAKIDINMNTSEAKMLGPLQADAQGHIVNGQWKEFTEGVACGEKRLYNAMVTIKDGKTEVAPLFPGHSHAGVILQHGAVQYASIGAGAGGGCVTDVIDTSLPEGEPSDSKSPWVEKWTVRACGKKSVVTMHFVPDATGTTITVNPKETVALP
jgi:hypothetical protein